MAVDDNPEIGFFNTARSFEAAAVALLETNSTLKTVFPDKPVRLLFAQALEHYLKACLIHHGMSVDEVRNKFSHRVGDMVDECERRFFHVPDDAFDVAKTVQDVELLTSGRYFSKGLRRTARVEGLQLGASQLFDALGNKICKHYGLRLTDRGLMP